MKKARITTSSPIWHYDVLRGLEHLRRAGVASDDRVAEAIDLVASKRGDDGEGRPSRWNTLRALRVLDWSSGPIG